MEHITRDGTNRDERAHGGGVPRESDYWVALNRIPGIGSVRFRSLVKAFGSAKRAWAASREELLKVEGIGPKLCEEFMRLRVGIDPGAEGRLIIERGATLVTLEDDRYPPNLRNIYDPPPVLYIKGDLVPEDAFSVAVVGSRRPTPYGRFVAERFARELAEEGVTVISGMARGIDSAAHKGALAGHGRTIAILGSGLDVIYPAENWRLAREIVASGALMTEFPFGTGPESKNFPARNRVISGVSLGVLVVEAGEMSGALITADFALEQGREVFAVPGDITSPGSAGTNRLIKQGAKLVDTVEDILEELDTGSPLRQPAKGWSCNISSTGVSLAPPIRVSAGSRELSGAERRTLEVLSLRPKRLDDIIRDTGLTAAEANATLVRLEVKGFVSAVPGKAYVRSG